MLLPKETALALRSGAVRACTISAAVGCCCCCCGTGGGLGEAETAPAASAMLGKGCASSFGEEGLEAGAGERARNLCAGMREMRRLRAPLLAPSAAATGPPRSVDPLLDALPPLLLAVSPFAMGMLVVFGDGSADAAAAASRGASTVLEERRPMPKGSRNPAGRSVVGGASTGEEGVECVLPVALLVLAALSNTSL